MGLCNGIVGPCLIEQGLSEAASSPAMAKSGRVERCPVSMCLAMV